MNVAASARLFLARRPWLYWLIVAILGTAVALAVGQQIAAIDATRQSWGTTATVLRADEPLEPGGPIMASPVELPIAAIPDGSLSSVPADATLRQRVGAGEVLVDIDIAPVDGPAARAAPDSVVVAVTDPLARRVTIGTAVRVAADGVVLAEEAAVVELVDEVIFVAVDPDDATAVAAAAQADLVSLLYLP